MTTKELTGVRRSVVRGSPYGDANWVEPNSRVWACTRRLARAGDHENQKKKS
jgi:hypothetical protein